MWCVRFVDKPNVWIFVLEERKFVGDCLDFNYVRLCEHVSNTNVPKKDERILWKPIYRYSDFDCNDYFHGDRANVTNQSMLNDFERIVK
jgi:hypothetical protein